MTSERAPGDRPGHGLGRGLLSGLVTTAKTMVRPAHTAEYPDVAPALPPRSRGVIALVEENCTVCMLCARECPDWCIYIDSHKETVPAEGGGRDRQRNMLDRFAIDFSLCMYCGICIEVCPFDALYWSPEFEYSEFDIRDLLHEKERLRGWLDSVPPPPAPDERAPEPREVGAARTAAEKAIAAHEAALRARAEGTGTAAVPAAEAAPAATTKQAAAPEPAAAPEAGAVPEDTPTVGGVPVKTPGTTPPGAEASLAEVAEPRAVPPAEPTQVLPPVSDQETQVLPPVQETAELPAVPPAPQKAAPRKSAPRKTAPRKSTPRKTTPRKATPPKDAAPPAGAPPADEGTRRPDGPAEPAS